MRVTETPLDRVTPPQLATRQSGPLIAVDLGTSNLRIAGVDPRSGRPVPLVTPRQRTPPSVVAVGPRGAVVVGQSAEQQAASHPELAVWGITHLIGAPFHSPQIRALRERLSCTLFEGPNGQAGVQLGDRAFSSRELVAMLLAEARARAQELLGQPVYRAVIAAPARRDDSLREFMAGAAALAGLHLAGTVSTPVAAMAQAGIKPGATVGVFDWGGGAFEFSVVKYQGPKPELIATRSDPAIGGAELDQLILGYLLSALDDDHPLRGANDTATLFRLRGAAERAKIQLSSAPIAHLRVPFVGDMASGASFEASLTREVLDQLLEPLLVRALRHCEDALDTGALFPGDITDLILVGEQSQLPAVQARCRETFHEARVRIEDPGNSVVLGACATASAALRGAR